jgi:hypothetical protein
MRFYNYTALPNRTAEKLDHKFKYEFLKPQKVGLFTLRVGENYKLVTKGDKKVVLEPEAYALYNFLKSAKYLKRRDAFIKAKQIFKIKYPKEYELLIAK